MKKRMLSVLLCLCMVCTLLPVTALAGSSSYSVRMLNKYLYEGYFTTSITEAPAFTVYASYDYDYGTITKYDSSQPAPENWNIKLSHEENSDKFTLVFNNLNVNTTADSSTFTLYLPGADVDIILLGHNSIRVTNTSIYIWDADTVTISGPGSLELTTGKYGIRSDVENRGELAKLTITDGATVTAKPLRNNSYGGIYLPVGDLSIEYATVIAKSNQGTGIDTVGDLTISSSFVEASGVTSAINCGTFDLLSASWYNWTTTEDGAMTESGDGNEYAYNNTDTYVKFVPKEPRGFWNNGIDYSITPLGDYEVGSTVSIIEAPTRQGYVVDGWSDGTTTYSADGTFTMPDHPVVLTAQWTEKATASIEAAVQTYTYDGAQKTFIVDGTAVDGYTVKYYVDSAWTEDAPTDFGTYDVKITREEDETYKAFDQTITGGLVINKAPSRVTTAPVAAENLVYDGTEKNLLQSTGEAENGTMNYSLDQENWSDEIPKAASAGEYPVYYKSVGSGNYSDSDVGSVTVTIAKIDSSLNAAPAAKETLVYNGFAQELVTSGAATGGEVQYKVGDNGTYSTAIPTATDAGTYTVYYKVVGDANHNDVDEASFTVAVTIGKKDISISGATVADKAYDGSETADVTAVTFDGTIAALVKGDDYTVSGTFPDANADTSDEDVTISVTLTGDALKNYSLAETNYTATAAAKINKVNHPYDTEQTANTTAIMSVPGPKSYALPYSDMDDVNYYVSSWTAEHIVDMVTPTVEGNTLTYNSRACDEENATDTITIEISSTNYNDIIFTLTVKATSKQTVTISGVQAATGLVYDGAPKSGYTGTLSCDQGWDANELTITYYLADGTTKTTEANSGAAGEGLAPKNVGSYTVTFAVPESSETHIGDLTLAFAIGKADGSVTAPTAKTLTYTGAAQVLINAGSSTTGEIQYKVGDGSYSTALPTATNAGTYTVSYKVLGDANHNDVAEATVSVTIAKATPTGTPAYTAITTSGKTLADAALTIGSITPVGGTIAWDDPSDTVVVANTAYGWTYTPTDSANYNNLTGSITPYVVSYSGGGGGSYTPPTYKVESEITEETDGSVSLSTGSAKKGDTVTITVTPDTYYQVEEVIVKDSNGKIIEVTENKDGTFSFEMPASKVTVEPVFSWDNPFTDVSEDAYYTPAVEWALKNNITNGTGNGTTFSPAASCTRAQMATFLWRAAGSPNPVGSSNPFADISEDAYYAKAVQWAYEQGITGGTSATAFSPDAACTRAQMVTFLHRVADTQKPEGSTNPFTDVPDAYYTEAVQWAYEQSITSGTSATTFNPDASCTRGQMVTFLYRNFKK